MRHAVYLFSTTVLGFVAPVAFGADEPVRISYDREVAPILRKHCATCHNPERPRGELDLSTYAAILAGGASGKAVVSGRPDDSPVYTMTAHLENPHMPPNKPKLPQRELDLLKKWVVGGLAEKAGDMGKPVEGVTQPPAPDTGGFVAANPFPRQSPVTALAVSPTSPLAAVSGRRQVLVFDITTAKLKGALSFTEGEVHVLRFSRDGKVLLAGGGVGGSSGVVVGFDPDTGKRLFVAGNEPDAILSADISPDKSLVAVGGPAKLVKVYAVPGGKLVHTFRKPTDWVEALAFSPDGLLLAAGDRFGGLFVWETKSGKEFLTLRGHTKGITSLAWRADGDVLLSGSNDGTVRTWNLHTGEPATKWDADGEGVLSLDYHPTGGVATGGRSEQVGLWNTSGKPNGKPVPAVDQVLKVAFSGDGRIVVAADWSGSVAVTPVGGGKSVLLAMPVDPVAAAKVVLPPVPVRVIVSTVKPLDPAAQKTLDEAMAELKRAEDEFATAQAAAQAVAKLAADRATAAKAVAERVRRLREELEKGGSGE